MMNLDDIYTPLEEAKEEIQRRWEDKELKKKVDEFLGGDIPEFLLDSPKAYLARHVASPNFEFFRFLELVKEVNLDFVLSEYTDDKYLSINNLKRHLGKMFFHTGINKNGDKIFVPKKVIDFGKSDRKFIKEVETITGKKLVDLHHDILCEEFPQIRSNIKDVSNWVNRNGKVLDAFYPRFLAFFIRNGVLFENFLLNEEEKELTDDIIIPAVEMLTKKFGIKPLIVRLIPEETENDESWYYYHGHIKDHINDKDNKNC